MSHRVFAGLARKGGVTRRMGFEGTARKNADAPLAKERAAIFRSPSGFT